MMKSVRIHSSLPVLSLTNSTDYNVTASDVSREQENTTDDSHMTEKVYVDTKNKSHKLSVSRCTRTSSRLSHSRSSSYLIGHEYYWQNQYVHPDLIDKFCQSPVQLTTVTSTTIDSDHQTLAKISDEHFTSLQSTDLTQFTRVTSDHEEYIKMKHHLLMKHQLDLEEAIGRLDAAENVYRTILTNARDITNNCHSSRDQVTSCETFDISLHLSEDEDEVNESFLLSSDIQVICHFLRAHNQFLNELSEYESVIHHILLQGQSLLSLVMKNQQDTDEQINVMKNINIQSNSSTIDSSHVDDEVEITDEHVTQSMDSSRINVLKSHASHIRSKFTCLLDTVQEREESLSRALVSVAQKYLDNLKCWILYAEDRIVYFEEIGPDFESLIRQCEDHRVLQDELDDQQNTLDLLNNLLCIMRDDNNEYSLHISSCTLGEFEMEIKSLIRGKWNHISTCIVDRSAILSVIHDEWCNINSLEEQIKHIAYQCCQENEVSSDTRGMHGHSIHVNTIDCNTTGFTCIDQSLQELMSTLSESVDSLLTQLNSRSSYVTIHCDTINQVTSQLSRLHASLNTIKDKQPFLHLNRPGDVNDTQNIAEQLNERDVSSSNNNHSMLTEEYVTSNTSASLDSTQIKCDDIQDERNNSNICNSENENNINVVDVNDENNTGLRVYLSTTSDVMCTSSHLQQTKSHQHLLHDREDKKRSQQLLDPCIPHAWRVKEWQRDMETVSSWLGRIEDDLGLEDDLSDNGSVIWDHLSQQEQCFLLNDTSISVQEKADEIDSLIHEGEQIIDELESIGKSVKIYSELLSAVVGRWTNIQQELAVKCEMIDYDDIQDGEQGDCFIVDTAISRTQEMTDLHSQAPDDDVYVNDELIARSPYASSSGNFIIGPMCRWLRSAETNFIWLGRIEDDLGLDDADVNCAVVLWDKLSLEDQRSLIHDTTISIESKCSEIETLIVSGDKIATTVTSLIESTGGEINERERSKINKFQQLLGSLKERWSAVVNELEKKQMRLKILDELYDLNCQVEPLRRSLVLHQKWLQVTESLLNQSCNIRRLIKQFKLRSQSMNMQADKIYKIKHQIECIVNSVTFDVTSDDSYKSLHCFLKCWQVIYDRNNQLNKRIECISHSIDTNETSSSPDDEILSISEENLSAFLINQQQEQLNTQQSDHINQQIASSSQSPCDVTIHHQLPSTSHAISCESSFFLFSLPLSFTLVYCLSWFVLSFNIDFFSSQMQQQLVQQMSQVTPARQMLILWQFIKQM